MDITGILTIVIIGALAGWLASQLMGKSNALLVNIGLGIVGGFVGNFLFGLLGISIAGILGTVIAAVVGAALLIFIYDFVAGKS